MEDKKRSKPETETAAEVEIEDLDVTSEDATEEVTGGFRAIRSTSRGFPSIEGTDEPAE